MVFRRSARSFLGPRIPPGEWHSHPGRYAAPNACLLAAALLLVVSIFVPYWRMTLHAPQYPEGLHVKAYLHQIGPEEQVKEINGLNHYIGMAKLEKAAQLERELSIGLVAALALLLGAATLIHNWWAGVLALPAALFPVFFLADLQFWLYYYGHNLKEDAPLSGAIREFTPPALGPGVIGQFTTVAYPGTGLILAAAASVLIVVGLWLHRRAFKPLVEAAETREASASAGEASHVA